MSLMQVSRFAVVPLLSLAVLLASPNPADAGKDGKSWIEQVDETFEEEICGIPVTTHIEGRLHFQVHYWVTDPNVANRLFFGLVNAQLDVTWTNAAGETLVNQIRQTFKDVEIIDHGDGTWTFTFVINGMPENLTGTAAKDVGRIVFQDTVYLGDLTTVADDEFIASEILQITGPHPEAESGFELFCQVFTEELG